jgi:Cu/Ag efflux protein CusF
MQSQRLARLLDLIMWQEPTARTWRDVMGLLASVMRPVHTGCHWAQERRSLPLWSASWVLSLFVCTGCAAYTPPPLTTQHPAHPEATVAPALPRSTMLAYGPADIPTPQPAISMAQRELQPGTPHGAHGAHPSAPGNPQSVVGEGKVIAVVPGSSQIVVDHGAITGFMDAMTMGYRIEPPSLLEGVQAGDTIRFTIDPQQKAIVKIEKMHK